MQIRILLFIKVMQSATTGILTLHGFILSRYTSDPDPAFHFKAEPDPASQKLCGFIHPDLLHFFVLLLNARFQRFSVIVIVWFLNVDYLARCMYQQVKLRGEGCSKFKYVSQLTKIIRPVFPFSGRQCL
jgi:hypothetical protein